MSTKGSSVRGHITRVLGTVVTLDRECLCSGTYSYQGSFGISPSSFVMLQYKDKMQKGYIADTLESDGFTMVKLERL